MLWGSSASAQKGIYCYESQFYIMGDSLSSKDDGLAAKGTSLYINGGYYIMDSISSFPSLISNLGHIFLTGDFVNHSKDVVSQGDVGVIHFVGNNNQTIYPGDSASIYFNSIEINKPSGTLTVFGNGFNASAKNITVKNKLFFTKGNLILEQADLNLNRSDYALNIQGEFVGEWDSSRVITPNGEAINIQKLSEAGGNVSGVGFHIKKPLPTSFSLVRSNAVDLNAGDGSINRSFLMTF